ncbi:hypothetical protein quinque_013919 [Culex quinquefasciatus]
MVTYRTNRECRSVAKFLERYGEFRDVYEEQLGDDQEFVGVYTGIRVAKMVVRENIGSWITINGEDTKCQYYAQKATCKHCHDYLDIGVGCVQNKKLLVQKNFADAVKQPTKPAMPQLQPNPQQPLNPQKPKPKPNGGKLKPSGALLVVPFNPLQIILPLVFSKYTTGPSPMEVNLKT